MRNNPPKGALNPLDWYETYKIVIRPPVLELIPVIQNVADPRRNGRIGKVFELAEPRFNRDKERDFRI